MAFDLAVEYDDNLAAERIMMTIQKQPKRLQTARATPRKRDRKSVV